MSKTISQLLSHFILIAGIFLMVVPIWIIFASSTHDNITILSDGMKWGLGDQLIKNYNAVLDALEKVKANNTLKGDLIKSAFITSTMGISYKLKLDKI